jgi:hypothetical protein
MRNYNEIDIDLFESKVGYDWKIKMMLCRVTPHLVEMIENDFYGDKQSWVNVIRLMFLSEGKDMSKLGVSVNGYYNSIRRALKEIGVIRYDGRDLVKGSNWGRFVSDEDWSWFKLNTDSNGRSIIVK